VVEALPVTLAWDLPTRLFKWTLVLLVFMAPVSKYAGDITLTWHMWNGYAILTLLVWRLMWGVVGGTTARFTFVRSPLAAARYGYDLVRGRPRHFLGHNPLGAFMVVTLMVLVAAQGVTGLFSTDDIIVEGPMVQHASSWWVRRLSAFHHQAYWWLMGFVAVHVLANIAYGVFRRDNLIGAMITGRKPAAAYEDATEATPGSLKTAALCLVLAAALVLGTIRFAAGTL
jgi:cytochrome b